MCVFVCLHSVCVTQLIGISVATTVLKNGLEIEHYLGLGKHALIHLSIYPSNISEPLTGDKDYGMKQSFSKRI